MIIVCPSCQARYRFDEGRLGGKPRARTRCARCSGVIEIVNPQLAGAAEEESSQTLAPEAPVAPPEAPEPPPDGRSTPASVSAIPPEASPAETAAPRRDEGPKTGEVPRVDPGGATGRDIQAMLELPKDKRFSLAVIQGAGTGQIFSLSTVRTTIGRSGADVNLDDAEASRQHASIEIVGDHAVLRDLGSTNGTFVDNVKIEQQVLQNHTEFRIGTHVLMLIVTKLE